MGRKQSKSCAYFLFFYDKRLNVGLGSNKLYSRIYIHVGRVTALYVIPHLSNHTIRTSSYDYHMEAAPPKGSVAWSAKVTYMDRWPSSEQVLFSLTNIYIK